MPLLWLRAARQRRQRQQTAAELCQRSRPELCADATADLQPAAASVWHRLLFALIVYNLLFLLIGIFGTIAWISAPILLAGIELLVGALPALAALFAVSLASVLAARNVMRLLKDTSLRLLFACAIGCIVNCNAVGAMDMLVEAVAVQPEGGGSFMQLAAGAGVAALQMLQRAPSSRQLPQIAIRAYAPPIPEARTGDPPFAACGGSLAAWAPIPSSIDGSSGV